MPSRLKITVPQPEEDESRFVQSDNSTNFNTGLSSGTTAEPVSSVPEAVSLSEPSANGIESTGNPSYYGETYEPRPKDATGSYISNAGTSNVEKVGPGVVEATPNGGGVSDEGQRSQCLKYNANALTRNRKISLKLRVPAA